MAATIRFNVPDVSIPAEERAFYTLAATKQVVDLEIPLHDARTDENIVRGPASLDIQSFAYVNHHSALDDSGRWYIGQDIEEVYMPEARGQAARPDDFYLKKGGSFDQGIVKFPKNVALVYGKEEALSMEPARPAHVDYTPVGLASTIRARRRDISEMAKEVIEAEDARDRGEDVIVPRYAAYSVWRPIKTVKRDPLVVCDYRSLDKDDLSRHQYRALGEQNESGEYMMEYWSVAPPKDVTQPRWYWMPEQIPDEVLIIKFADTAADSDSSIAKCCPHAAAVIAGTEEEEPRSSVECRVLAFW